METPTPTKTPGTPPRSPPRSPPQTYVHPFAAASHSRTPSTASNPSRTPRSDSRASSHRSRNSSFSHRERTMPGYALSVTSPPDSFKQSPMTLETVEDEDELTPPSPLDEKRLSGRSESIHVFNPPTLPEDDRPSSQAPTTTVTPVAPSFLKLFTITPWYDTVLYLAPALAFAATAGLVTPYMALEVGSAFSALSSFPPDPRKATPAQKARLMHDVGDTSIKFVVAGVVGIVSNYFMSVLWIRFGEKAAAVLRRRMFEGVAQKPMVWYDLGMGLQESDANKIGAGGLMAKFTRETDDVRISIGLAMGTCVKAMTAAILCIILGFVKQPLLSVVILSSYPVVMIAHAVNQVVQEPLYRIERRGLAEASTLVERATRAIATVKAFNAQIVEGNRFRGMIHTSRNSLYGQAWRWANMIAGISFLMLVMFVAGFWYGAVLVSQGKASVASVMTAFWACLLASTNAQSVVMQLAQITKGKMSLSSLLTIIKVVDKPDKPDREKGRKTPRALERPARCRGVFDLTGVQFSYPSRPGVKVLRGIDMFFPDAETTFVVGGSGSGKSTIAQLLLRLYDPDAGEIRFELVPFNLLPRDFCREHIAAVQQGCILFDVSIHDNVALGLVGGGVNHLGQLRRPEDVTREEVIEACKMAYIHDFIAALPDGYDTKLGAGGSALSGGQQQRIAIARARIRDPTVLILDEATSALDATSRIQVFEAIRAWRKNRTTVVITHDLSQITATDFVYVMKDGIVAEQGYRRDLMIHNNVFAAMAKEQALQPLAPRVNDSWRDATEVQELIDDVEEERVPRPRPASMASFYTAEEYHEYRKKRESLGPPNNFNQPRLMHSTTYRTYDPPALAVTKPEAHAATLAALTNRAEKPSTQRYTYNNIYRSASRLSWSAEDLGNGPFRRPRRPFMDSRASLYSTHQEVKIVTSHAATPSAPVRKRFRLKERVTWRLLPRWFPTVTNKPLLFLGLAGAIGHGVCTPLWSYYIAKLIALVGVGDKAGVASKAGTVMAISAAQSISEWIQFWALSRVAAQWTADIRDTAFCSVMEQDKSWFDRDENQPQRLLQHLIKDVDDMRHLLATILPNTIVVVVMVGISCTWALVVGWKLTLVGIAMAPLYIGIVAITDSITGRAEEKNKRYREELAKTFYESVANVRGIRAMALEPSFNKHFMEEVRKAQWQASHAAWVTSFGAAFQNGLPLFVQALMNYVGAQFIKDAEMSYMSMLQVYTLILFALTFTGQLLTFLPMVSKCRAAAYDFDRIHALSHDTVERTGVQRFPIRGEIVFDNVHFSYPTRPDVPILKGFSLQVYPNESVAIVGASGSGKSTVAALLQRLYEPTSGTIHLGDYNLANAEVTFLRNHIGVVSQTANLFDASVADNISYGAPNIGRAEIIRACKEANINGFILSLPQGYETNLGENASLISGGQAQRLQIARALVRHASICILDECTSALDVENQRILLEAIQRLKETSTTIMITHSLEAMRRCDYIVCLDDGRAAEAGSFDELIARGGVFARLMSTGEWES